MCVEWPNYRSSALARLDCFGAQLLVKVSLEEMHLVHLGFGVQFGR